VLVSKMSSLSAGSLATSFPCTGIMVLFSGSKTVQRNNNDYEIEQHLSLVLGQRTKRHEIEQHLSLVLGQRSKRHELL